MVKENDGKLEAEFSFLRATKNKQRFDETTETGMDEIYIPKSAFEKQPEKVKVVIEVVEQPQLHRGVTTYSRKEGD